MASNGTVSFNSVKTAASSSIKLDDEFELDPGAYELRRAGQPLKLGRIPMELSGSVSCSFQNCYPQFKVDLLIIVVIAPPSAG